MPYITADWLSGLLELETEQQLLDALEASTHIAESLLVAMQTARNDGSLGKIEGLGYLPFEPGHCWNEFCEDPDGIVPRERDDLAKIMGPKIEAMIRDAHKAHGKPDAYELIVKIAAFVDHPVIELSETQYLHPLEDQKGRIFVVLDGYAPRAYVAEGVEQWQPLIADEPAEPDL